MALTLPFINTIPAFDATQGTSLAISVVGGDAITGYQFTLYDNQGTDIPFYTSQVFNVTNDIPTEGVRTFPITIPANASGGSVTLTNNERYRIAATIFNATESLTGNYTTFLCYQTPNTIMQYLATGGTYTNLEQNSIMPSQSSSMQFVFNPQDINSVARPNKLTVNLYGMQGGNQVYIGTTGDIYKFTASTVNNVTTYIAQFDLDGFSINLDKNTDNTYSPKTDALYSSYIVEYICETIEGMTLTETISGINCYYVVLLHSPFLNLQNLCNKGVIQITCEGLTSIVGTSNPTFDDLTFLDGEELDLTESGSWVQWQKFFILNQPYILGIWCRDLQDGVIASLTSSTINGAYITLTKETSGGETFISLKSGLKEGYPYYIESQRIATSSISSSTNLYIGIQSNSGLFDIDFEILS